jgi:hypothetical protein
MAALGAGPSETGREHRARMRRAFGFRPSVAAPCPRRLAGQRCLGPQRCICQHWTLFDHAHLWRTRAGAGVLTVEPYNADGAELADFLRELGALGLSATITGHSPWNLGRTFLITIARPAARSPHSVGGKH